MSASAAGAPDRGGSRSAVTTRSPTASAAARREDPDSTTNHLRKPSPETQRSRAAPEGAARDLHTAARRPRALRGTFVFLRSACGGDWSWNQGLRVLRLHWPWVSWRRLLICSALGAEPLR